MTRSEARFAAKVFSGLVGVVAVAVPTAPAAPQIYSVVQDCYDLDTAVPLSGVIEGADGALYGCGSSGGSLGHGSIFKVNRDGSGFVELHSFDGTTGSTPSGLMQASDGVLYGTTESGGAIGSGTLFKIDTDGSGYSVLVDFDGTNLGASPMSPPIEGADGVLYGTTAFQGSAWGGTFYRINKDGSSMSVLFSFDHYSGGANPFANVIQAADGAFYGTMNGGGAYGDGTIYTIYLDPVPKPHWIYKTMLDFGNYNGGAAPWGALMQGSDDALYGMTSQGGSTGNDGVVFKINTDGSGFTVLHEFDSGSGDFPETTGSLVQGPDGAIYGVTTKGGPGDVGSVFKMTPDGSIFTTLWEFGSDTTQGAYGIGLTLGTDHYLYGTTTSGGTNDVGVVFRVAVDPASWSNYGSGLAGTIGIPSYTSSAAPVLGTMITLSITDSFQRFTTGFLLIGTSRADIPYKGGSLLVGNIFSIIPLTITPWTLNITGSVPNDPSLAGFELDSQVHELDDGAVHGVSLSQGLALMLGW